MKLNLWIATILLGLSCNSHPSVESFDTADLVKVNRSLLEVAMVDGFSPPVASRVYVYPHIAFYTTLRLFYPDSLADLAGSLNNFPEYKNLNTENANPELTALLCFAQVSKALVFSEQLAENMQQEILAKANSIKISPSSITASKELAAQITKTLIPWIKSDNYIYTRTLERYTSSKLQYNWRETPPDYTAGLEPNWSKIRPLITDSSNQYKCNALPEFSLDKKSDFYKTVYEVYAESKQLDSAKINIALYWDDNPNVSKYSGHLMRMEHKISPPGHWLNIIGQFSIANHKSIFQTSMAYTLSSIAMFDGIIQCWKTKYETNIIRPISYILENIDESWRPLIQTPPFPEFTSGHSVVSAAAAEVLSQLFGKDVSFIDSTEVLFGHPVKKFTNFHEAAMEVSLSRYYGGIHYKHSVLEGNKQGIFIAQNILQKLNSEKH
ncbi:MAG: vanadium-dependent haloperoxidase [Saprospiraceae bacterium]